MNPLATFVDFVGRIPWYVLGDRAEHRYVREIFHFMGGALVALAGMWNLYVQMVFGIIMIGILIYGEIGDLKTGSSLGKSFLDISIWIVGFSLIFSIRYW